MDTNQFFWYWIGFAAVLFIFEIISPTFGALFAGVAALLTAVLSYFQAPSLEIQMITFVVLTMISLFTLRPLLLKKFYSHKEMPSRTENLVGKHGILTEAIASPEELGRVSIDGTDWSAKADQPLNKGQKVKIISLDGLIAKVETL